MVFLTKNALADEIVSEVEQKRYSLSFSKLVGNAPLSVYMCSLPGGGKRHIKQARPKSATWFFSF